MPEKLGVQNLLKMILLGVEVGNVADKMGRAKGMARYMYITELFDEVVAIGSVDFHEAKREAKDLDDEEKAMIQAEIAKKLDIVDDELEMIIEDALAAVQTMVSGVIKAIDIVKRSRDKLEASA